MDVDEVTERSLTNEELVMYNEVTVPSPTNPAELNPIQPEGRD